MMIQNSLRWFINSGYDESFSEKEKYKVRLLNKMALVIMLTMLWFIYQAIKDHHFFDVCINSLILGFALSLIWLQHLKKFELARTAVVLIAPIFICIMSTLFGPKSGADVIYIIIIIAVLIFFENKKKHPLFLSWIGSLYLISQIYTIVYGNPMAEHIQGYGRIFLFGATIFCSYLMIHFFFEQNKKHEQKTEDLLSRLEVKNSQLKEVNGELERFFYIATHDLKTPLRGIIGFIGLAKRKMKQDKKEEVEEFLGLADTSAQKMLGKIVELLDFSKTIQTVEIETTVVLQELLNNFLENSPHFHKDDSILFDFNTKIVVEGKPQQLHSVFQNLIDNGIKYNESPKPTVKIYDLEGSKEPTLVIEDNGIGIEKRNYEKVFDMFKRLHTQSEYEGSGIGLALCKKIVNQHGGKLWIDSEKGKGSRFFITFPKATFI